MASRGVGSVWVPARANVEKRREFKFPSSQKNPKDLLKLFKLSKLALDVPELPNQV